MVAFQTHSLAECHLTLDLIDHQQSSLRAVYEASDEDARTARGQEAAKRLKNVAEKVNERTLAKKIKDEER